MEPIASKLKERLEFNWNERQHTIKSYATCEWISSVGAFVRWKESRQFSLLWIHGKSGSGKSILAAYIMEMLQAGARSTRINSHTCSSSLRTGQCDTHGPPASTVLYFLCGVQPAFETPSDILRGLIHQCLFLHRNNWKLQSIASSAATSFAQGHDIAALAYLLMELAAIVGGV